MGSVVQGASCWLWSPVYTPAGLLLPLNLPRAESIPCAPAAARSRLAAKASPITGGLSAGNCVSQPTFKGEWYAAVNFALLLLLDTRLEQCPRPHRRSDDALGCRGAGGWPHAP